jgi:ubiquinone/menaquinone biosynthesis C-methylase UbiE
LLHFWIKETDTISPQSKHDGIIQHYTRKDLGDIILTALRNAGKDIDHLKPEDLAPLDEFHVRGRKATFELAQEAELRPDMHVLDVGCGIGGPSRYLAREFGCRVTGIDLIDEYCRAAQMLADRTGISNRVTYRQGDASALPFPDAAFDFVWTQHAAMNIPDKENLYREMSRVLKNGGTLAIYDVLAGPVGPVYFPVPWARHPEDSHLISPDTMRRLLEKSGFAISSWKDTTKIALSWFSAFSNKIQQNGPFPLGIHVLLGPDFKDMARNQRLNLEENRIAMIQVLAKKQTTL